MTLYFGMNCTVIGGCMLAALAASGKGGEVLPLPFDETFGGAALVSPWQVDAAPGNAVRIADGALEIRARENTYAHIQHPLGQDFIRASCEILPDHGNSWATALTLYWDALNYTQIGLTPNGGGQQIIVMDLVEGVVRFQRLGIVGSGKFIGVAIEVAADGLRYYVSGEGIPERRELIADRPGSFMRAPALLIAGRGHANPPAFPREHLDNSYTDPGPERVSRIRNLHVTALDRAQLRLTAEDAAFRDAPLRDVLGEQEMAGARDPSFESVSRHFPAMKWPREVVGTVHAPFKIGVDSDGSLEIKSDRWNTKQPVGFFEIGDPPQRFGAGDMSKAKRLHKGYLPVVVVDWAHNGLKCEEMVFGYSEGMNAASPLYAWARLQVTNVAAEARKVPVSFRVVGDPEPAAARRNWTMNLAPGEARCVLVRVPFDIFKLGIEEPSEADFRTKLDEVAAWWEAWIGRGTRFDVPEQRVMDAYRAWITWGFLNVPKRGEVYHICDGTGFYDVVFGASAAHFCHVLDCLGYTEQAATYYDSTLTFQEADGVFAINSGFIDNGAMLWSMARHYQVTRDEAWLKRMTPTMLRLCNWALEKRQHNLGDHGFHPNTRLPDQGLVRYRPYCDYPAPAVYLPADIYHVWGMKEVARVFENAGMKKEAARLRTEAEAYLGDIVESMKRSAVWRDGMRMLPMFPETQALLRETDYLAKGYYALCAPYILETGLFPPGSWQHKALLGAMERRQGLVLGQARFYDWIDHAYTYGYWQDCLDRGESKRVVLGFYGMMAYGMSRGTYSPVEVTDHRTGENHKTLPHTYSCSMQLRLLRNMLLREEGDTLVLAGAVPRPWLEPGKTIAVNDAPTIFGKVSYRLTAAADGKSVAVRIVPPERGDWSGRIRLRLRHPLHLSVRSVEGLGPVSAETDVEEVVLWPVRQPVEFKVVF